MVKRLPHPLKAVKGQKGVALLIALFAMSLMIFVALEVSYDTSVDYVVAAQQVHRIQAYYAAKSGLELGLLRIMLYKQAMAAYGDSLGTNKNMLDPIWSFPFMWPPTAMDGKMTEVDKDMIQSAVKEALMQAQYTVTISPEGGKLDINDLGSPIKALKKSAIAQVVKIFESEKEHNEEFAKKYSGTRFEEIANNIADYIDEDNESLNGGDEGAQYRDLDDKTITLPPNRPLRTIDELHQVAGINEDFYRLLAPKITVFGTKGINVNYANKDLLMALDITMTEEAADKVIERRNDPKLGGPFQNDEDFLGFIRNYGVNIKTIQEGKIPLLYEMEFNFRVTSTGVSSNVKREIVAITYDFANLTGRMADLLDKQLEQDQGTAGKDDKSGDDPSKPGTNPPKRKIEATKGRPTVVYWEEN